jgi:acyl-coenzyme A synthetase/AMP-(fatty) acid ligase
MRTAPHSAVPESGVPVSRLLCDTRTGDEPLAFDRSGMRPQSELSARVAALGAAIEAVGAGRWLVVTDSALAAAAALLALGRCGGVAVLAPGRQPETLRRCAAGVRGVVCSGDLAGADGLPDELARIDADAVDPAAACGPIALDRAAPWVELHTSGTTGEPRCSRKLVRHLQDEVSALEALLGPRVPPDARIFATVPHHHIYGLLFRVLWPLASGRPFQIDTPLHVREIAGRMAEAGPCALVTTPVHLRHLVAGGGLAAARPRLAAVFSSGAPLDGDTAAAVAEQLGAAPFEILGSTETGGVALRQRSSTGDWWIPFPEVSVERDPRDGTLTVTSPFASEGEPDAAGRRRFAMGDRVELASGGRFQLLGRADRSVKIGGLRLSLPAMEHALVEHAWVREAALVTLSRGSVQRVAAALVLGDAGRAALHREGRRACSRALSRHLASGFDAVLLPRAWRYVDELPRNAQGKIPQQAVELLFAEDDPGDPAHPTRLRRRLHVPPDLPCLEGHFPGHPIVPGVAQIGWVLDAARELLGGEPRLRGLEALKFPTPLRPGDRVLLELEVAGADDVLHFSLGDGKRIFASGRCRIETGNGGEPQS